MVGPEVPLVSGVNSGVGSGVDLAVGSGMVGVHCCWVAQN